MSTLLAEERLGRVVAAVFMIWLLLWRSPGWLGMCYVLGGRGVCSRAYLRTSPFGDLLPTTILHHPSLRFGSVGLEKTLHSYGW